MEADYRILRGQDIIKASPAGVTDLPQSKQFVYDLAVIAEMSRGHPILVDLRQTYSSFTPENVRELIDEIIKHPELILNKMAILARDDEQVNKATLAEILLNLEGFQAAAFTDFEKAVNWLQSSKGVEDIFE